MGVKSGKRELNSRLNPSAADCYNNHTRNDQEQGNDLCLGGMDAQEAVFGINANGFY